MTCQREDELLDALGRRYIGADLQQHLAGCASCRELHAVAGALLDDRVETMAAAPVPSSGTMWWRMQIRRRNDAVTAARRSLLVGQALTLVVAIALLIGLFGGSIAFGVRDLIAAIRVSTPLLLALATLVLAPLWGWAALRGK